jgi:hypothetical protein
VDGIAEVHGIDEDEARRIGAVAWTSDGSGGGGGGGGVLGGYPLVAAGSSGARSGSVDLGGGQVRLSAWLYLCFAVVWWMWHMLSNCCAAGVLCGATQL